MIRQGVRICRYAVRIIPKRCPDVTGNAVRMLPKYAFIDNTFFNSLYKQDLVLDNDLSFRGFLDQNRLFVIRFLSEVGASEVLTKKFTTSQLDILCGIGQIRGFNAYNNLIKILIDHIEISRDFFINKFYKKVLIPINENINLLEKEKRG